MKTMIKTIFTSATLLFATLTAFGESPSVVAMQFHADYCGSCKIIAPKLDAAKAALADEPVLFLKLDHTSDVTKNQAKLLVGALKLEKVYAAQKKSSGFVLLVDADSHEVVGKLTKTASVDEMKAAIAKAVQS